MPKVENYWGIDFKAPIDLEYVAVLKQQAAMLEELTSGTVCADVVEDVHEGRASAILRVADCDILCVSHDIGCPEFPLAATDIVGAAKITLTDMEEFRDWLKDRLSSPPVRRSIGQIKKRVQEAERQWRDDNFDTLGEARWSQG